MRRPNPKTMRAAAPLLALALGACALSDLDRRGSDPYRRDDVAADRARPQRVHYRYPGDASNVRYYERDRPDVVVQRRMLRESDGRTYYVEREQGADRRTYFDDDDARSRGRDDDRGRGGDDGWRDGRDDRRDWR
jgi:hypothetical protein